MSEQQDLVLGALIKLVEKAPGEYVAIQSAENNLQPPRGPGSDKVIDISWSFGPIVIHIRIDLISLEISICVEILGIKIGCIRGNLKDGLSLEVNLFAVEGSLRFYGKNDHEIWVRIDLDFKFGDDIHEDVKIADF